MREGICGNINKALREGIVCRQEIETNKLSDRCKLTMVRFEDNILLHALSLQSKLYFYISCSVVRELSVSRDGLWQRTISTDTEDEVRCWSRGGQDEGVSLSDTG